MVTANSRHTHPVASSLLNRQFDQSMGPNQDWNPGNTCVWIWWGSQYYSEAHQRTLKTNRIQCSMSQKGDCWDNTVMESFFATLKQELFHRRKYTTWASPRYKFFENNEVFYNRKNALQFCGLGDSK